MDCRWLNPPLTFHAKREMWVWVQLTNGLISTLHPHSDRARRRDGGAGGDGRSARGSPVQGKRVRVVRMVRGRAFLQILVLREEVLGDGSPNEREVWCAPHLRRSFSTFAEGKSPAFC